MAGSLEVKEQVKGNGATCLSSRKRQDEEIWSYYELEKCLQFIKDHKTVTLQFPDDMLHESVRVSSILQRESKKDLFVLGDTSYGSCCVDEVGAEHIGSDGIIHFGTSCLTETKRLPVLYVFGKEEVDEVDLKEKFEELFPNKSEHIIVLYDVVYHHIISYFSNEVSSIYPNVIFSKLLVPSCDGVKSEGDISDGEESFIKRFGRCFNVTRPLSNYKIFYIGSEGPTLTNFMLTYRDNQFYSYNPSTCTSRVESLNVNQMLRKRYYLIQKAKEANTIGILVGTLGAVNYLSMIERLKEILKAVGKKFYTVAVGKLNPAKLANFMEVELYVIVACPHCSLLDTQEYYRPIVTPFEMEVACLKSRTWSGDIELSYQELLPGGSCHTDSMESDSSPDFSFLTGRLLSGAANEESGDCSDGQSLITRGSRDILLHSQGSGGPAYLKNRTWQGLERRLGETPVSSAEEGRSGLPINYSHEDYH
ncbi:PREDICTED: diphthamide biosynthesis protein 2-like [Amphimedon queenslandica]|uniref:2-(3-amino-3-carboxypropyl)histidine synthase subunit 2 n=1 Tax=Amphimedon queenslandica TaxID=400682 RepID=A0A1X7VC47_AMPQE|nr:PREDICTED: diphthamide biosynthesis protein 2-like [Amphimedon queenslandica]|eukprot:XP_019849452.1 PREDICTED: diphthamide biosynthesis protein 2-like [Amphimedon queenslandica]